MAAFLHIALAFPTIVFSLLLVLVVLYWGMVLIGAVDLDLLDGAIHGASEGALDAAAHGVLDGAADAALDGAADAAIHGVLDGAADAALDGAAEAALDGGGDAALDGALDGAADGALDGAADGGAHALDHAHVGGGVGLAGLLGLLRLRSVPVTVSLSFIILSSWLTCTLAAQWLAPQLAGLLPAAISLSIIGLASFLIGLLIASLAIRPLAPFFKTHEGQRRRDFLGAECSVTTSRVDARFGQAEIDDGGAGLLVQVRCDLANPLTRGQRALVIDFDERREAYVVEPLTPRS